VVCGDEYGEIGTVYQAAGFDYVGVIRAGGRAAVTINDPSSSKMSISTFVAPFSVNSWRRTSLGRPCFSPAANELYNERGCVCRYKSAPPNLSHHSAFGCDKGVEIAVKNILV